MCFARNRLKQNGLGEVPALEESLKAVLIKAGASIFASLLSCEGISVKGEEIEFGEKRRNQQPRTFQTLFGPIQVSRTVIYRYETGTHRVPFDEALGIIDGCTPALTKLMCRAAARGAYAEAADDLLAFSGIHLNPKRIHRAVQAMGPLFSKVIHAKHPIEDLSPERLYIEADGTGIPLRKEELKGKKGKQADGSAKTHEVKVGCIFTQCPRQGLEAMRDPESTSYIATVKRTDAFGPMLLKEARRRNLGGARESVFISDGAAWLREIARTHFPATTRIVDFYHAAEHLHELAKLLLPQLPEKAENLADTWCEWMKEDRLEEVMQNIRNLTHPENTDEIEKRLPYFEENAEAMRYGTFIGKGMFIGSGVVEAGCKSLVAKRMKNSGAFWSQPGAANVLDFRAALKSRRFDALWDIIINKAA